MPTFKNVNGYNALSKQLSALGSLEGGKVLRAGVVQATTPVVRVARSRIPVNDRDYLQKTHKGRRVSPGFAKRNIAKRVWVSKDKRVAVAHVGVKSEAFYAVQFVELGTSKQPPQRWLRVAHRATTNEQLGKLRAVLRRKILEIGAKQRPAA